MITMLFFLIWKKNFKIKKIRHKLRQQVLEAGEAEVLRVEVEAIQKLLLRYSWFKQYFPKLKEKKAAVVRNPFSTALVVSDILDELQDHYYDHQNDSSARDVFQEMALSQFWFAMREFFPQVSKLAFRIFLSFATTYLCESDFSALVHIKRKARKIEDDMRLVLSNTKPRIPKIDFAVAKSTVALTDVKLSSYLKLNIFEVFFVIIFICTKSTAERGSLAVWNSQKGS